MDEHQRAIRTELFNCTVTVIHMVGQAEKDDAREASHGRTQSGPAAPLTAYSATGWRARVVYECELKDKTALSARLAHARPGP